MHGSLNRPVRKKKKQNATYRLLTRFGIWLVSKWNRWCPLKQNEEKEKKILCYHKFVPAKKNGKIDFKFKNRRFRLANWKLTIFSKNVESFHYQMSSVVILRLSFSSLKFDHWTRMTRLWIRSMENDSIKGFDLHWVDVFFLSQRNENDSNYRVRLSASTVTIPRSVNLIL